MKDNTREEIAVDSEMLSPVLKLRAISQLFDGASEGQLGFLDENGCLGISGFLDSIADEIMDVSHGLNDGLQGFSVFGVGRYSSIERRLLWEK